MAIRLSRDAKLIHFPTSDGLQIEGRLMRGDATRAVVLCHPHPLYGGSMLTPVIMTAEQAYQEAGYTTLAFNFRGVGGSEGSYGDGRGEMADVTGALDFLAETLGGPPLTQVVAGYSFGSVVGGRVAATDSRVYLFLGIAPPLNLYDFDFLRSATCRVALICGSRDEFCDPVRLGRLVASLPEGSWVKVLGSDHFFSGHLNGLSGACRDVIAWGRRE